MGWQTKNKAFFTGNRLILPLYSDGFGFSLMAITDDGGKTWHAEGSFPDVPDNTYVAEIEASQAPRIALATKQKQGEGQP